jgi:hypothetical protein
MGKCLPLATHQNYWEPDMEEILAHILIFLFITVVPFFFGSISNE